MWHFVPQLFCDFLACIVPGSIVRLNYLASISTVLETANKSCQRGGWWSGEGEAEPLVSKPGHGGGLIGQP